MNNMKRLLASVLALSLIVICCVVTAEDAAVTNDEILNEEKALSSDEFYALHAMGMLSEDVVALRADALISRAQFVGTLFKIAGYSKSEYKTADNPFIDVNAGTLYKDEICYFYKAGFISGTEDNMFSPDDPITYQQAVKIIVEVCGYRKLTAAMYGVDLSSYFLMGRHIALTDNMKVKSASAPLKAEEAIQLLYNAGRTKIAEGYKYGSNGSVTYSTDDDKELFSLNNEIYYREGIVQSNGIASLLSGDDANGTIIIDGEYYKPGAVDLVNFLGCRVKFFYESKRDVNTLLWVCLSKHNSIIEIESSKLMPEDKRYSMTTIVYEKGDRTDTLKISPDADIVYNNALYNDANLEQLKPAMGFVRLIDNNSDNIYDIVIVEEYRNIFATGIAVSLGYIPDKYGAPIRLEEYKNIKIFKDGIERKLDEIEPNCVISVVEDKQKNYLFMFVNGSYTQDTLLSVSNNGSKPLYRFENAVLELSESYKNIDTSKYIKIEPSVGKKYKYFLDKNGRIAELQELSDNAPSYALLINAMKNNEIFSDNNSAKIKLLLKNGNITTAVTKRKIKLNGVDGKTGLDILADSRLFSGGEVAEQVVKVAFNAEGLITEFEFAEDKTNHPYRYDESVFSMDYSGTQGYYTYGGIYRFNKYCMDSSITAFVKYKGLDVKDPYGVEDITRIGTGSRTMKLYDICADQSVTAAYVEIDSKSLTMDWQMLVSEVGEMVADGETVKYIGGFYGGTYVEYTEALPNVIPLDLKRGDLISIALLNQKIIYAERVYNLSDKDMPPTFVGSDPKSSGNIFSYIYAVSNKALSVVAPDTAQFGDYANVFPIGLRLSYTIPVTIYDVANDSIYKGEITDVCASATPNADGSFPIEDAVSKISIQVHDNSLYDLILVYY